LASFIVIMDDCFVAAAAALAFVVVTVALFWLLSLPPLLHFHCHLWRLCFLPFHFSWHYGLPGYMSGWGKEGCLWMNNSPKVWFLFLADQRGKEGCLWMET
jgi:hypothetical protein